MRRSCLTFAAAALALGGTLPAAAQSAPAAAKPAPLDPAPLDPATLAEARLVVARLMPPGIYKQIMGPTLGPLMDSLSENMKAMPLREIAELGGLSKEEAARLDKIDLEKVMAIYDPHWQERTRLQMHAMLDAMGDFLTTLEPEMREAVAHAYASRFTLAELTDVDHFFATPSGAKFAMRYMTISSDPAVLEKTKTMMPKMLEQLPHLIEAAMKATADLPQPNKIEDLSAADKAKLAQLLGVQPDALHQPKEEATP